MEMKIWGTISFWRDHRSTAKTAGSSHKCLIVKPCPTIGRMTIRDISHNASRLYNNQTCARIPNTFSLIQDPDHNKEDTSFISVVAYSVYIPLSHPIQFCALPNQNFDKNVQDPVNPAELWIQDPSGFLLIFMGFKSCQRNSLSYKKL